MLGPGRASECSPGGGGGWGQPAHGSWPYWDKECKRPGFAAGTNSLSWPGCCPAWSWGTGKQLAWHPGLLAPSWGRHRHHMAGQQMATSWAWPLAWPHPAPACVGLSHIPRADTLPRAAGMHVPWGRGTARAPGATLPSQGGMDPVLPPHGAALTCCRLPVPPSWPQHLAAHPNTELQGGKGPQWSAAGGHMHPTPLSRLHPRDPQPLV